MKTELSDINEWESLSEWDKHGRKLERYAKAHSRSAAMAAYMAGEVVRIEDNQKRMKFNRAYERMSECGSGLAFRQYYKSGRIEMLRANFCTKYYLCPFCAILRAAKCSRAYIERLEVVKKENPNIEAWFVTFTVRNGFDLVERFEHLRKSFRAYQDQRRQGISRGTHYNELQRALGAVYSIEIAFDRKNGTGWHPHIHMVALCERGNGFEDFRDMSAAEKRESRLATEWERICGDSFVVDARPMMTDRDIAKNFSEVFKYALKFSEMSLKHNFQAAFALQGSRLVGSFGLFRGVKVPDKIDEIDQDDLAFVERLYHYTNGEYQQFDSKHYDYAGDDLGDYTTHRGARVGVATLNEINYANEKIEAEKEARKKRSEKRAAHFKSEHIADWDEWLKTIA